MLSRLLLLSVLVGMYICKQIVVLYLCCVFRAISVVSTVLHIDVYAIQNVRMVFQCSEAAAGGHLLF